MSDKTLIPYGAPSMLSRWFRDYWTERDRRAAPWLIVCILLLFLTKGPNLALWLVSLMPLEQLGNSGASIMAHNILLAVASVLSITWFGFWLWTILKPNHILVSPTGIAFARVFGPIVLPDKMVRWSYLKTVFVALDKGRTASHGAYQLFLNDDKQSEHLKLDLRHLEYDECREALVDAFVKHARSAQIDPYVIDLLSPQRELSFTEIWISALSAPPHRERLLPLDDGTLLEQRYRTVKRLGAGGQGTVYLAEDTVENKQIVLKETILPVYADLVSRKRSIEDFHREAQLLAAIKHPQIVSFLGSFVFDHRAYLLLEYFEGQTLKTLVESSGPVSEARAIDWGMQICELLGVLHKSVPPLMHRDFTPDNLIVRDDNKLVLLDFAAAVRESENREEVAGKTAYMAPEQLQGNPTPQSDLYGAGGTLFFALTGQHPDALCECHPITLNDNISKKLNDVVAKATKYESSARFQTVDELDAALRQLA